MVLKGIGPQRYEIRELGQIYLRLSISQLAGFRLTSLSERIYDALLEGYPILRDAHEKSVERWFHPPDIESPGTDNHLFIEDAFAREKTRLMLPADPDEQP